MPRTKSARQHPPAHDEGAPRPEPRIDLRARAEAKVERLDPDDPAQLSPEQVRKLIHELRVHQVELEMQNEELRQTQESLEGSRARYFDLYDLAPVGYVTLGEQGSIREANLTAAGLLGIPRASLAGKPLTRFIRAEDQDVYYRLRQAVLGRGAPQACELRLVLQDGTQRWARLEATVAQDPENGERICRVTVSDITEQKELVEARLNVEKRLLLAQKIESLGVLAGGVAHDFNNLLAVITGFSELAMDRLHAADPVADDLREIRGAAMRASELTRQMLAYSGKGGFVLGPVRLSEHVEDMRKLLGATISKRATLVCDLDDRLPVVVADGSQMDQVILNLVINASEALGEVDGEIRVLTRTVQVQGASPYVTICGDPLPAGSYVCLEVSDTGCGMDSETRRRIFDPFFSTKRPGRGLGLAAVQGIVLGHSGAIRVESEPGRGTSIQLLFPASALPSPGPAGRTPDRRGQPGTSAWKGTGTVLIVDDEEKVLKVAALMVESAGFSTLTAPDGDTAIRLFREHLGAITCVLLDLTMPVMDGKEVFEEIRRIHPRARVVLTSGYSESVATAKLAGKGLAGFVQKPFLLDRLIAQLRLATEGPAAD